LNSSNSTSTGRHLFSFGVITDTHIRTPGGDLSSPFPVNELANDRARYACGLLAAQNVDFNIHLGDMVHPLPAMDVYETACEEALTIFSPLQPNLYFVPGNHDIGDKPMPGLPAAAINDAALSSYKKQFGDDHYSFEKHDCLFVVLNSSLINSEGELAEAQAKWLEETLAENKTTRVFLFLHYPLFIHSESEDEHYDNIAEPGRSWLIGLLRQYSVELVLSGHVHHHFYNRVDQCKCYVLPPTSFTRQDYAEMFKVDPASEYGRDDEGKYSVAVVDVFEKDHRLRIIPTNGAGDADLSLDENSSPANSTTTKRITVPLRHAWYESIDLPYNGPMEEFSRKRVRNDYIFMRLRQMGIADVRVPIDDVINPISCRRVSDYVADGFKFHGFCPQHLLSQKLEKAGNKITLLSSLECVVDSGIDKMIEPDVSHIELPLVIGNALTGAHRSGTSKVFAHSVSSGFNWADRATVLQFIEH